MDVQILISVENFQVGAEFSSLVQSEVNVYREREYHIFSKHLLRVSYITANIYCKLRNLHNIDVRNYSIELR